MTSVSSVRVCVLTVSDSCSAGLAEDTSGPALAQLAREDARLGAQVADTAVVPDTVEEIRRRLVSWADGGVADIILTTGGTGDDVVLPKGLYHHHAFFQGSPPVT